MKSILEGRPALKKEVDKIAEVAGYLWQNGWAERNGGNITVNITDLVDDSIRAMKPISDVIKIGETLPHLKGCYFFCKGTQKRMRDLARWPMDNGSVIRILDDCASYDSLVASGSPYRATLHTHPIELVAMSHNRAFLKKDVLTKLLWSMIPETKAFCPLGLGVVPYEVPGSNQLAQSTLNELSDYDVVLWEKHGVFAKGLDIMDAFDQVDVLSKSAKIYIDSKAMGFEPEGMSDQQMADLTRIFKLPK